MHEIITYLLIAIVIFLIYKTIESYYNSYPSQASTQSSMESSSESGSENASEGLSANMLATQGGLGSKQNTFVSKQIETFDSTIPADHYDANMVSSQKAKYQALESKCPIFEADMLVGEFQRNMILDKGRHCGDKKIAAVECPEKFRDDFFSFRNNVMGQSHQNDMAMRVAAIYLDGNQDVINKLEGRAMKDIFDDTMKETNLYTSKSCARLPHFDDTTNSTFYSSCGAQDAYISRDTWTYPNEKNINGGDDNHSGVYDVDPRASQQAFINQSQ